MRLPKHGLYRILDEVSPGALPERR
jgi:hypothetical protein